MAITAMCIRQGKGGSWEGLGKSGFFLYTTPELAVVNVLVGGRESLTVSMGKAVQPPPTVEAE